MSQEICNQIQNIVNNELTIILTKIAEDFNINKELLLKTYINSNLTKKKRKKNKIDSNKICMARKQDGNRCTRRKKEGCDYCGKHIHKRKFGRIDEECTHLVKNLSSDDNFIMTSIEIFDNEEYLIDENNIVYTKNISAPTIIGKKISENHIQFIPNYKELI